MDKTKRQGILFSETPDNGKRVVRPWENTLAIVPNSSPLILLTNDDGVNAPGLRALCDALAGVAELLVVGPSRERSAVSHAVTVGKEMAYERIALNGGLCAHALDATPADCVKLGVTRLAARKPDLVVSGINAGANIGNNILYSGTVAAALEGAMFGIPGIAVSLDCRNGSAPGLPQYATSAAVAVQLAREVLERGLPPSAILNVNVPNLPLGEIRGIAVSRQGKGMYIDVLEPRECEGEVQSYRNVGFKTIGSHEDGDCDDVVLGKGWVSVTPLHYDLTRHSFIENLKTWFVEGDVKTG